MTNFRWTRQQDDELRLLWDQDHSTAEIGRRMGVTKNAVIGRAHRLQLPSRGSPINLSQAQAMPWTEEDDALLRRIYGGFLTAAEIGARMGRTTHAIAYRAAHLGLKAGRRAQQTRPRVSPSAQPSAGRGASSPRQSWPATISRASSFRAVERLDSSPQVENLPEADMTPPRVFLGTECKYPLHGDERPVSPRFCAEPVRDNAKGCASPYCAAHYAECYVKPVKKTREERQTLHVTEKQVDWRHFYWARG